MVASNHDQPFRPLRGGISIFNPASSELGTIGLFARSQDGATWIISCHHVLWIGWTVGAPSQPIAQPGGGTIVADTDARMTDAAADFGAARIRAGVSFVSEILGLGPFGDPLPPAVGLHVVKSGAATGITEGVVADVHGSAVRIEAVPGFPPAYELTAKGDSGAVWISRDTRRPVALHRRGNNGGVEFSEATSIRAVLETLGLSPI